MSWIEKAHTSTIEHLPIYGLHFLDGDVLARLLTLKYGKLEILFFNPNWLKNQKFPQIGFPSRLSFDIWETTNIEFGGIVHLFGEMDLPYFDTRDNAWEEANRIAEQVGYLVRKHGDSQLEIVVPDDGESYRITYDKTEKRMVNVERLTETTERLTHPAHVLLPDEVCAKLPPLYTNEQIGFEAQAVVKYFTPDAHWTWYASEASALFDDDTYKPLSKTDLSDPHLQDVIFFGLVIGDEIEYGYFNAMELHSVRGNFDLLVERDLSYQPKTLRELKAFHERERGGG